MRSFLFKCLVFLAAGTAAPAVMSQASGAGLHVALNGDDHNPGTEAKPLKTLLAARNSIRTMRGKGLPPGGVTVWVHEGLYTLDKGFTLDQVDSGEDGKPVIYRAAANERVRLFGGVRLHPGEFKPVTEPALLERISPVARDHVLQFSLASNVAHPARYPDIFKGNGGMMQLLLNDRILPLSRWPNVEYATMAGVTDSGIMPPHGATFHYRVEEADHVKRWRTALRNEELWLTGFWRVPFETESVRVQAIDEEQMTLSLAAAVPNGIGSKYSPLVNGTRRGNEAEQYFAFNLLEEIDTPGEWSYDFERKTLYLWPPADWSEKTSEVLLANAAQPVVTLRGANFVTLQGLEIEGGVDSAVLIEGASHVSVAGSRIHNTGGGGVDVQGGAFDSIQSDDLDHIGSFGIRLIAGDRRKLIPANHAADNNHISFFGQQERITQAVYLGGVGNRATHNLIHDGPYHGIEYQGNDQRMAYNEIHHIGLDAGDMGVFYTNGDWAAQGNVVMYNFAHHSPNANGAYLDDGSSGRKIVGNIFYKLASGIFLGGGHTNVVTGNLIVDCKVGIHVDDRGVARHYDDSAHHLTSALKTVDPNQPPWSTRYPEFLRGIVDDPTHPTGNLFSGNVLVGLAKPYSLSELVIVDDNANPVLPRDNLGDQVEASFERLGDGRLFHEVSKFKPIPFAQIGLKKDVYRRSLPTDEETGRYTDRKIVRYFDSNEDRKASDRLAKPQQ